MLLHRSLRPLALAAAAFATLVAGCASVSQPPSERTAAGPAAEAAAAPALPSVTLDGYKRLAARKIVAVHPASFEGDLPPMLKSVVVLDITVDRDGKVVRASVRRSNGYKDLEQTALESVRKAAPLPAPSVAVHRGATTVSYVETWLFRADGRFQIRSLAEPQKVVAGPDAK
jgi:protein TonB